MGYYASVDGTLRVVGDAFSAVGALANITSGYSAPENRATAEESVNELATLLKVWLPVDDFEVTMPGETSELAGRVEQPFVAFWGYGKLHEEDEAFAAIASYVLGEVSFEGSDSCRWRVRFAGGEPLTDTAVTVYDCEDKDHVSDLWIGQVPAATQGEPDILVSALDGRQVRRKLAVKCRRLLAQSEDPRCAEPEALDDIEALTMWQTISGRPVTILDANE